MTKDWRLEQLESQSHLRGAALIRKRYQAPSREWDHDHCVACWATLAERPIGGTNLLHEGYTTTADFARGADYDWNCVPCFESFSKAMEWRDVTPSTSQ